MNKVLITGAAGFIGAALVKKLIDCSDQHYEIIGLDNLNSYYDVSLKLARIKNLGVDYDENSNNEFISSSIYSNFRFVKMNLEDKERIENLFKIEKFDYVVNLAAQAGVRYSLINPYSYIESNIKGFLNILEGCRTNRVKHLVFASSSSVYGLNAKVPFSEHDNVDHPVSLYAATKKSNELMAHSYSYLYDIPTTGLRFFTVYGPWGRPDMSPFLFIKSISEGSEIKVFNNGDMIRDFTYVDDVVESIARLLPVIPEKKKEWDAMSLDPADSVAPFRIYNVGNSNPIKLIDYISEIENALGKKALKKFLPMQPGDVYQTNADSSELYKVINFRPSTKLSDGIKKTVEWYASYYNH